MTFKIEWTKRASEQLDKLDNFISKRILKKIDELINDPFSRDVKKLKGEKAFRLRVGDFRVILEIEKENKRITVIELGHRRNIYY